MKRFPFNRPAHWLAAGVVGAAAWVIVADPFPQLTLPDIQELEISEVQYLRPAAKRQLARDLVAENRTLLEVAALFDALECVPPRLVESVNDAHVEMSPEERTCRRVIAIVGSDLYEQGRDWKTTVDRLEAQLDQARNQPGGLKLPPAAELEPTDALLEKARRRWHEFLRQNDAMRFGQSK